MPDAPSAQLKCAVTGALRYPAPLGAGDSVMLMLGFRVSILIPASLTAPTLPARSVACPTAVSFPVVEYVIGAVNVPGARPESASVAEKLTTTGPFTHPSALASGDRVAFMTGAVRSMLSVMLAVAVLPDLSVAVPENV